MNHSLSITCLLLLAIPAIQCSQFQSSNEQFEMNLEDSERQERQMGMGGVPTPTSTPTSTPTPTATPTPIPMVLEFKTFVSDLASPRQLTFSVGGETLYVAEAGFGGSGPCTANVCSRMLHFSGFRFYLTYFSNFSILGAPSTFFVCLVITVTHTFN